MRDREDIAAGLVLVGLEVPSTGPSGSSLPAGRDRGVRLDLAGLVGAVAEDDDAMQVVAAGVRGPLVADEGGETAGLVVGLGRLDVLLPGRAIGRRCRAARRAPAGTCPWRSVSMTSVATLTRLLRRPSGSSRTSACRSGRRGTRDRPANSFGKKPMLSEWSATTRKSSGRASLTLHAVRRGDLLAAREAEGLCRTEPRAEGAGIHRGAGVQVGVAPADPAGSPNPGTSVAKPPSVTDLLPACD